ncbi:MAG: glycosyltransferase family 4 protein [Halobacteriota archaeon]
MKITFVLPGYSNQPTGGFKVVYEYANHLVRMGYEVTIVFPWRLRRFPSKRPQLTPRKISRLAWSASTLKKPKINWYSLDNKIKLAKVPDLDAHYIPDADAVFATHWTTSIYVNDYPNEKGVKFYLVMDFPPWMGDKSELEQTWRMPLKKVAISSWLAELILEAGALRVDTKVVPIAVDHDCFRVINNVLERPQKVIMLYSTLPYKRSQLGLSALLRCKDIVPDLQVSLFGPIPRRPKELPGWVDYHGRVSEGQLNGLYNSAAICLCSSAAEGFALPPAEAMACGCAVVTTDCGGNRDYAQNEETALVSDPDDFVSLVNNVLRLLSDEELRVRITLAGRDRIMDFTWQKSVRQLVEFISSNLS